MTGRGLVGTMRGQWLGTYKGKTQGAVTVELDDLGDHYEGMVYVYPGTAGFPPIAGAVMTIDKPISSLFRSKQMLSTRGMASPSLGML